MKKLLDSDIYFYPAYKCRLCGKKFTKYAPQKTDAAQETMEAKCSRYGHEETIKIRDYMMDGTWHICNGTTNSDLGYADFIGFLAHKFDFDEPKGAEDLKKMIDYVPEGYDYC